MEYARRIRPLTYGDFKRIKSMLGAYVEKSGDNAVKGIISAAQSDESADENAEEGGEGKVIMAFMDVLKKIIVHLDREVHVWFCDLIGVTEEEYDSLPVDMDIQILNQLKGAPEVGNFFTGVSLLSSGTGWFQKLSTTLKDKCDTLIESLAGNLKE